VVRQVRIPLDEAVEFVEDYCVNAKYSKYYMNVQTKRTEKFLMEIDVEAARKVPDPVMSSLSDDDMAFVLGVEFAPGPGNVPGEPVPDDNELFRLDFNW